ncbi:MAG: hypothetical protein Tsb0021_03710 [Chlamydiales bacterium]
MEFTTIPPLNQKISRIGLGTWAIGGWMWGGNDEQISIDTIRHAIHLGVNLIDTAPVYGFGLSEEIVGKAIKSFPRDEVVIATKAGLRWKEGKVYRDNRKSSLEEEIDHILKETIPNPQGTEFMASPQSKKILT